MLPHKLRTETPKPGLGAEETVPNLASEGRAATKVLSPSQLLLDELFRRSLILVEEWDALPADVSEALKQEDSREHLLQQLMARRLLTPYQAEHIQRGNWGGLILGNYRVMDQLGAGGMGVVLLAEHLLMRHLVALKILPNPYEDHETLPRFLSEIRHVTVLHHPNIVAALDAGKTLPTDWENPNWYYLVMEFVPGTNLEKYVQSKGPLPPAKACDLICQVASALAEAHKQELVHRDVKPSNILVTPEGQAKLTDFGLSRTFRDRHLTKPGTVLGSIDYIAPEQALDSTAIDHRADLYSLGATLYWCLAGQPPFPPQGSIVQDLAVRQTQSPPHLRNVRLDIPAELSTAVSRMMALRPEDRYPTAQALIQALLPFLAADSSPHLQLTVRPHGPELGPKAGAKSPHEAKVLLVDDDAIGRRITREILQAQGMICEEAPNAEAALVAIQRRCPDLILLDINLPQMSGADLLRQLRLQPPGPNLKIIMLSGEVDADQMAEFLTAGADDYLPKPTTPTQLVARVKAALDHKEAQDRAEQLNRNLQAVNAELERNLSSRAGDLVHARNGLVLALAELAELRTNHGVSHLLRVQRFTRFLAEEAMRRPAFADQIDATYIAMLDACAPLHDIGQMALPDHILQKAGKLDVEERLIMQTHTTMGADILHGIAQRHRSALSFLQMAIDIARHHHEAYAGTGYPDRLAGIAIPLSARLVAISDVYDALRSRRPQRPPLSHLLAVEIMIDGMPTRFDPQLLALFKQHADRFERIYQELPDK